MSMGKKKIVHSVCGYTCIKRVKWKKHTAFLVFSLSFA